MESQKSKVNIIPSESALQHIVPLSPEIDDISTLLNLSTSVTPENITQQKEALTMIRKVTQIDHGVT